MSWKEFFNNKKNIYVTVGTFTVLIVVLIFFPKFLAYVEVRQGIVLPDPVLNLFNPVDLTWLTFALIYLSLLIAVISFIPNPIMLVKALQCYSLLVIIRTAAMYVTPFDAPANILPLNDPFVQLLGSGDILTKDLFFSGHTATLFLLFLLEERKYLKVIFIISTVVVGASVLLQHVHYTIDVFAAPFFAYGSFRLVTIINNKISFSAIKNN
ncbi:hypothetical protein BMS3Abin03_01277 [bacterium BMS3Abin03]|nr:hypothetical protein BMS3Abin03_01277 [bacterium BMS3Abin03]